ncbi:MAG TPA: hypothetical protein VLJ76_06390 [Gaiellaceae bacterium]|nr:hypothetical protein [Gaiellaceae bacterium]
MPTPSRPGFVILRENAPGRYELVGEARRRPGLTAKKARRQAVAEAAGREPGPGEVYAAVLRSEWRISFEL